MKLTTPLVLALTASFASAQIPCFSSNVGAGLGLGDDAFSNPLGLGFSFTYAGVAYTDVQICSNGFLVLGLGSPGSADYTPTVNELLANPQPRLCPLWSDLRPAAGGGAGEIYANAVAAAGTTPAHFIITFDQVQFWGSSNVCSFQIILIDGGSIQIHYEDSVQAGHASWVAGASPGNGSLANPISLATLPILTSGNPTLHDNGPNGFPIGNSTHLWTPDGTGGYIITNVTGCASKSQFGDGCYDKPRMVREDFPTALATADLAGTTWTFFFTPTGAGGAYLITPGGLPYDGATAAANGTNITNGAYTTTSSASWDDASLDYPLSVTSFPTGLDFPGGNTTTITINSNGKIYLGSDTANSTWGFNGSLHGDLGGFRDQLPCLAPFMTDLDPSPTGGGAIYVEDPSPSGGLRVTWHNVPNWDDGTATTAVALCDIQVEFIPGGIMTWAFGSNLGTGGSATNDAVTGFSAGGSQAVSSPIDWSGIAALTTGDGSFAPTLDLAATPIYGTTVDAVISNVSPGTGTPFGGFLSVSLSAAPPGGIHLPTLGIAMPECYLYVNPQTVLFTVLVGYSGTGDMTWSWTLPASGPNMSVYMQGATLTPTPYNPVDILVTNGVKADLGL